MASYVQFLDTDAIHNVWCFPHGDTSEATCSRGISLVDLAQQKTWPSDYWKLGEMPAGLKRMSSQRFRKDLKSALILLDPQGCSSPPLPDTFSSDYGPNPWISGLLFPSSWSPSSQQPLTQIRPLPAP